MRSTLPSELRRYQALLAPGTGLRDGLERIVHGRTGALIVLGHSRIVDQVSTGGFALDVEFTPTALRELSKLDGGIVMSSDLDRILAAGVHFVPDGSLPTLETGTRHRSADRVAQQTGVPVVTVSSSMSTIALFMNGQRYAVERPEHLLSRANQALAAMVSYRDRLTSAVQALNGQEVQDMSTIHDVAAVAQRLEMVQRLHQEVHDYVSASGSEGRLTELQLHELSNGLDELAIMLELDYRPEDEAAFGMSGLDSLDADELLNLNAVARAMGFEQHEQLDTRVTPRGYRQLSLVPRLSAPVAKRLLEHFGSLQAVFGASTADLLEVEGVGEVRARAIRDGLLRLLETASH